MCDLDYNDGAVAGSIRRRDIEADYEAVIAIFPTQESGVNFMNKNNAWGFVSIARSPDYIGMYVSGDVKKIQFFASVKKIVPADEASSLQAPKESEFYDSDKKVIVFEPKSLYELQDPIPFGDHVPYSVRYTDIYSFQTAEITDDLF